MSSSADPPKLEHPFDASPRGSSKSVASSPEFGPETPGPGTEGSNPQDPPIVQKRKGGRKPVSRRVFPVLLLFLKFCDTDICHVGGAQAAKQASASSIPRTAHGVHQAT